tara:strand:+ start:111 stop:587 length:477 start_codon:yes stop_codon:yes gene_type:complete
MSGLNADLYTKTHPGCYDSAIGGHVRHNLDHYLCLEDGLKKGRIDYDARLRNEFLETNPDYAANKMAELIEFLNSLATMNLDLPLKVKMDSNAQHDENQKWSDSSLRRELQFLISHTIHHYALIMTLCSADKVELPADFGVPPSTLRFRKSHDAQCAR